MFVLFLEFLGTTWQRRAQNSHGSFEEQVREGEKDRSPASGSWRRNHIQEGTKKIKKKSITSPISDRFERHAKS